MRSGKRFEIAHRDHARPRQAPYRPDTIMRFLTFIVLLPLAVALASCGSTGQLTSKSSQPRIKDYDQVVVMDFSANDVRPVRDAEEKAERDKNADDGRMLFSEKIAEQITETKAFKTVSRKALTGKVLIVTGTIDVWEPGNLAARAVTGFIGQSQFASTIRLLDGATGEELARISGDRNSWPLPIGASTTILQTVNYFMNEAALNFARELAARKGIDPQRAPDRREQRQSRTIAQAPRRSRGKVTPHLAGRDCGREPLSGLLFHRIT
ncbi:MAG: DUF4410 domain-containing protein [Burkholderiaceae bacterium]